jgi:bifunctional non-homologous end joining protein LigD
VPSKPRRSTHRSPPTRFVGRGIDGAAPAPFPDFIEPCCPVERKEPPSGGDWLHEIKHDGYRAQAHVHEGAVSVFTRRGNDWAARMPTIAASVKALPVNNTILDGELVAVDAKGQAVFYELPSAITAKPTRVTARLVYYAFDLLYLDGFDLRGAALVDRKRFLEALLADTTGVQLIKYVDHIEGDGEVVLQHACKLNLEGIVSKRANAPYRSGRSAGWIKTKCPAWREANRDRFEKMGKR